MLVRLIMCLDIALGRCWCSSAGVDGAKDSNASDLVVVLTCSEVMADMETPLSAYLKVRRGDFSFLLESVEGAERVARYRYAFGADAIGSSKRPSTL